MKKTIKWFAALSIVAACSDAETTSSTESETFEEFAARTYKEPWPGGVYIINGDTPVESEKALFEIWKQSFSRGALAVHHPGNADAKWDRSTKRALTYCVSDAFGANKPAVLAALAAATEQGWETFANVDFVHRPEHDASCSETNTSVVFDIRPTSGQPYLARAFFPGWNRATNTVWIDEQSFTQTTWPLGNILAHELGHVLGFRHEHTRPEAGACFEDGDWRALTPYDAASVMHYPQCNGTNALLEFSATDRVGAAALYGAPGVDPSEPPALDRTFVRGGSLLQGQLAMFAPVSVKPGSIFQAQITGSGDADLYVRFGEAPTTELFHCRPFVEGSAERCVIDVPANESVAHVMVYGYAATPDYWLSVEYTDGGHGPHLVIEEILADPSKVDANGDGTIDPVNDEMVEIVNIGGLPADLSNAWVADESSVRFSLPPGTIVGPGEVLVVFGGGNPKPLGPGVHIATGRLFLNNGRDKVSIYEPFPSSALLATASYGQEASYGMSVTRKVALDETAPFVKHTSIVRTSRASPGRRTDGSPY